MPSMKMLLNRRGYMLYGAAFCTLFALINNGQVTIVGTLIHMLLFALYGALIGFLLAPLALRWERRLEARRGIPPRPRDEALW